MEVLVSSIESAWRDRPVFLTGHTGFKGGWLALWLHRMGAQVHGYALNPISEPGLFDVANVASALASDTRADLADVDTLKSRLNQSKSEVVFHLAAQPLVRESYRSPLTTLATNVIGTVNVLEAIRSTDSVQAVVLVTTDKVYDNKERSRPYRESDQLGGRDVYSASKAAAEIVAASYRASFFGGENGHSARVATARAGNVIGGGDWATDRLVPDCIRAFANQQPVKLRYPNSVRPWQHVLEPLAGYLSLAEKLLSPAGPDFAKAWNFGPDVTGEATVGEVASLAARIWEDGAEVICAKSDSDPHEAGLLKLDCELARRELGWRPVWSLEQALQETVIWHKAQLQGEDMYGLTLGQISAYEKLMRS